MCQGRHEGVKGMSNRTCPLGFKPCCGSRLPSERLCLRSSPSGAHAHSGLAAELQPRSPSCRHAGSPSTWMVPPCWVVAVTQARHDGDMTSGTKRQPTLAPPELGLSPGWGLPGLALELTFDMPVRVRVETSGSQLTGCEPGLKSVGCPRFEGDWMEFTRGVAREDSSRGLTDTSSLGGELAGAFS